MGIYSEALPQLNGKIFITDAGLETELCFLKNVELPEFASYTLLREEAGYTLLFDYYTSFARLGSQYGNGLVLETPTWRANADWGRKIGDSAASLAQLNRKAVALLQQVRDEYATADSPIVISGNIGPRGDGYVAAQRMTADAARQYHAQQIATLVDAGVDLVSAFTMNYIEEAIGITLAAKEQGIPVVISFTVETDGRLPTGETLEHAITATDRETGNGPIYYMINCAHPTHFEHLIETGGDWVGRIRGLRGNASRCSHAELDNSKTLDQGDPQEFGEQCFRLNRLSPALTVLGGCCGTDRRHIETICRQLQASSFGGHAIPALLSRA